jgi:hypothetical protein
MAEQPDSEDVDLKCPGSLHTMCCHLIPSISNAADGDLRLDWDAGGALCTCPCHAECPMTASRTASSWPEGCSCPGTVAHVVRESRMSSSFGKTLRTSVDKSRRRRRAQEDLRRQASGRSVEEVDQMIDDIWPKYGLPVPVGPDRPWIIDHARNPPGYASQVRMTADILAGSGRFISGIVGMFREPSNTDSEDTGTELPTFYIQTDTDAVAVILDDGTQELVGSQTDGIFTSRLLSTAKVTLRRAVGDSVEVWTHGGTHDGSPVRLGIVPGEEGPRYLPLLRAAERVEQELVCPALRAEGPEGKWYLYLKFPQTSPG